MAAPRTRRSRPREAFSYLVSLCTHAALVWMVSPCVAAPPRMMVVRRLTPEAFESAQAPKPASVDRALQQREAGPPARDRSQERAHSDPSLPRASTPAPPDARERDAVAEAVEIVHTDAPGERPADALAESRYDRSAAESRHAPVTSVKQGPDAPESADAAARVVARGSSQSAPAEAAAGGAAPAPRPEAAQLSGATSAADGVPVRERAPDWWAPIATRVRPGKEPEDRPVEVDEQELADPEPDAADEDPAVVEVERPHVAQETTAEREREREAQAEAEQQARDRHPEPAPVTTDDAVVDAAISGEARAGDAPTLNADPRQATSHQTVVDAPLGESQVAALATERGAWIQKVDAVIRKRWGERQLPTHLVGIGVRGDVTVRFSIDAGGQTREAVLVKKSGNEWLDAYALDAIPPRVPRMPRELALAEVEHEITFRYR